MTVSQRFPPQPTVEHLTTIFRRIDSGRIVVPAFQRAFVWEQEEVLELLESVLAGYPIGSVLLWSADTPVLRVSDASDVPFPVIKPEFPVSYVLDGLQRLSSLYGVFHYDSERHSKKFDVSYDLDSKRFFPSEENGILSIKVPLNALFNPRRLLDIQRSFIERGLSDTHLSALTDLQARFQEYMIPLVTLSERDLEEVVVIFERVNSTGTKLSRVDFMRAITWSASFDLNDALDSARSKLDERGFELSDDTLVKALGLLFGLDPLPNILLDLRSKPAAELSSGMEGVVSGFERVFSFLREEIGIFSSEFVPYEGQLLTLFKVFSEYRRLDDRQNSALRAWFFWTSFEEVLQGRPDNFVARMIRAVTQQISDGSIDIPATRIDPSRFIRRRLLKGKALTSAFVTMMAQRHLISLGTQAELRPSDVTSGYNTTSFVPIFPLDEVKSVRSNAQSAKVPANVLVTEHYMEVHFLGNVAGSLVQMAGSDAGKKALERQLIGEDELEALASRDVDAFLNLRAERMADIATELVKQPSPD